MLWLRLAALILLREAVSRSDVPVVCSGYVKAAFRADFSKIKINLYTMDGTLKYSSDCSSSNGYFLLPVYDQGEYLVKLISPEGWMTSPPEVSFLLKGSDDPCAGRDILFELTGFRLQGQVHNHGGMPGSSGVEVLLTALEQKVPAVRVHTVQEGRFIFEGVVPGTYHLTASHQVWQISQDPVQVVVEDDSMAAPPGLSILGYDVNGSVMSGGEPVQHVLFFLFSEDGKSQVRVNCRDNVNASIPANLENKKPLCTAASDSLGKFLFYPLPPEKYFIVPYYQQDKLEFEVHPTRLNLTILNNSVLLQPHFEVQGFSVSGYVTSKDMGSPVAEARVSLTDVHVAVTNDQGFYSLPNVTSGSYYLKAEAPGMEFESREVHISPSSPSLPPLFPRRYLIAGQVHQTIPTTTTGKVVAMEIEVTSTTDAAAVIAKTSTTPSTGKFSLYLPLGEFRIKVVVSEADAARGLKILPSERVISMVDSPATSVIEFSQFVAEVSGTIRCIEDCPESLSIVLKRKSEVKQSLIAQVKGNGKEATFIFTGVLPGAVQVHLNHDGWCWERSQFNVDIDEGAASAIEILHTGYSMPYETSHDTLVTYHLEGESGTEVNLTGTGFLCLGKPGVYYLTTQSCHSFGDKPFIFKTSSPKKLVLQSSRHAVTITLHCAVKDPEVSMLVRTRGEVVTISADKMEEMNGTFMYTFSTMARAGAELKLEPKSSLLMFSPSLLNWLVGNDCPEEVPSFRGSLGQIVEGKVVPPLAGVAIILNFGEKGSERTQTDKDGAYRVGPFHGGIHIELSAEMNGYAFELQSNSRTFSAIKLSRVDINVTSVDGGALSRVLVSVNGESFRQNAFTDNTGSLTYHDMAPGQYFIKPFLREFDFTPSSQTLTVTQGMSEVLVFIGRRVAFSCSGHIYTLNRHPVPGATIQGSGQGLQEGCSSYSETSMTSEEGVYSLLGLLPGCQYTVSVRQDVGTSHVLPSSRSLTVEEEDVEDLDFLVVQRSQEVYISGWVKTEARFIGTLKGVVYIHGSKDLPLHTVAVDPVGFFEFPPLPSLPKKKYVVFLETNLASNSYRYSTDDHVVSGVEDSYLIMPFSAEEVLVANDPQSRGSVVALVMVIIAAFAAVNFEMVVANVRSYFRKSMSGISDKKASGKLHKK